MRSEGQTQTGAATVHWQKDGRGPAIVFVHGFPLSGHTWNDVVHELSDRFTCYMPDLIGLGESSSTNDDDYSSQGQARALRGTLDALGVDFYALVGNDTGGWVARELALIDRKRVTQLVLTNTEIPRHRPPWIPAYQALAHVPGFAHVLRRVLQFPRFLRSSMAFGGCYHDASRIEGELRERYIMPLLGPGPSLAGALRFLRCMKFARLDEFDALHAELTMPALFIWGADDPTFPERLARPMAAQFPGIRGFHAIANARLFFYEEHPRLVAGLINGFLSGRKT